jgi:hypothetical protein
MEQANQIKMYNQTHYASFEEAKEAGAIYSTNSSIDATENRSAFMDAEEIVDAVSDCFGCKGDIVAGIETDNGFVTLSDLAEQLN